MSDLFHPQVPATFIKQVLGVMADTPQHTYQVLTKRSQRLAELGPELSWPANAWVGVSIESDRYVFRANHLRQVDSAVRFLSLEPLLGPLPRLDLDGIHWVIVGGESGPDARTVEPVWIRDLRDRCESAGIPFFFKQWGGRTPKANGRSLDGQIYDQLPLVAPIG
jgi:protein gp37